MVWPEYARRESNAVQGQGQGQWQPQNKNRWHQFVNTELVAAAETKQFWNLVKTIEKYLPQMNLVNITTAMHRLAKLGNSEEHAQLLRQPSVHTLMGKLMKSARDELAAIKSKSCIPSPQSLSNIMWSNAILCVSDLELFNSVVSLAVIHLASFKPLELSTLLWACAKLQAPGNRQTRWADPVFDAASYYIQQRLDDFTYRNMVTAVGAFANMGKRNPRMFTLVADRMVRCIQTANAQELAKTAWSFGTANVRHEKLFAEIAKHSIPRLKSFQAKELSNLLWGFAANDAFHAELFTNAAQMAQRIQLNAQQLANIFWALTRVRPQLPLTTSTVTALLPRCCQLIPDFKPQEIASTAMSIAKTFGHVGEDMGYLDKPLPAVGMHFFTNALPMILPQLRNFSDQSLANIATAYTAVRAHNVWFILSLAGAIVLERVVHLEPTVMLQLIRTFLVDPGHSEELSSRRMILQALFKEAGVRAHRFGADEQRSLARLCKKALHLPSDVTTSVEALRHVCTDLGNIGFVDELAQSRQPLEVNVPAYVPKEEKKKRQPVRVSLAAALAKDADDDFESESCSSTNYSNAADSEDARGKRNSTNLENLDTTEPPQLKIKNTFIEDVEASEQRFDPALARPPQTEPFDFLRDSKFWPMHQNDLDMIQAIREDYQGLRAVQALDIVTVAETSGRPLKKKTFNAARALHIDLDQLNAFRKDYQECRAVPVVDFSLAAVKQETDALNMGPLLPGGDPFMPKSMKKLTDRDKRQLGDTLSFIQADFIEELEIIRHEYQRGRAIPALDYCAPQRYGAPQRVEPTTWLANGLNRLSHDVAFNFHHGKQPKESKPEFIKEIGPPLTGLFDIDKDYELL